MQTSLGLSFPLTDEIPSLKHSTALKAQPSVHERIGSKTQDFYCDTDRIRNPVSVMSFDARVGPELYVEQKFALLVILTL